MQYTLTYKIHLTNVDSTFIFFFFDFTLHFRPSSFTISICLKTKITFMEQIQNQKQNLRCQVDYDYD